MAMSALDGGVVTSVPVSGRHLHDVYNRRHAYCLSNGIATLHYNTKLSVHTGGPLIRYHYT
eukprot:3593207-Pyramimonas_sp.AAC.1